MAYINQEMKKNIAAKIAPILRKHGLKGSLSIRNHMSLVLTIKSGVIDFGSKTMDINKHHYAIHLNGNTAAIAAIRELFDAMNEGNWDRSDITTDYFDVGFYTEITVGKWDKDYVCSGETIDSIKHDIDQLTANIESLKAKIATM